MTPTFDWKNGIKDKELNTIIDLIKANEIVIVPTETVYGLAANGTSDEACKKIFIAKGRKQDNPLIIHVSDKEMINKITKEVDLIEFLKHEAIRDLKVKEKEFILKVHTNDDKLFEKNKIVASKMQQTLEYCRRAVNGVTHHTITQEKVVIERI